MLAKPEYFSLPDEVCCWPGRRSGAAGTGSRRKQLAGAPWRSCWYEQPAEAAGGSAAEGWSEAAVCAEKLPLRERCGGGIEEELAAGRRRCGIGKRLSSLGKVQSSIGKRLNGSNQHFTPFLFQCHRPHIAIPIITKYNSAA